MVFFCVGSFLSFKRECHLSGIKKIGVIWYWIAGKTWSKHNHTSSYIWYQWKMSHVKCSQDWIKILSCMRMHNGFQWEHVDKLILDNISSNRNEKHFIKLWWEDFLWLMPFTNSFRKECSVWCDLKSEKSLCIRI